MSYIVRDLPKLTTVTSSGGAGVSNIISQLDDASSITIFFTSSANVGGITSSASFMVSGWDPALPAGMTNMTSSQFVFAGNPTSSLTAMVISNISFRSFRFGYTTSSSFAGEVIGFVSKQITV